MSVLYFHISVGHRLSISWIYSLALVAFWLSCLCANATSYFYHSKYSLLVVIHSTSSSFVSRKVSTWSRLVICFQKLHGNINKKDLRKNLFFFPFPFPILFSVLRQGLTMPGTCYVKQAGLECPGPNSGSEGMPHVCLLRTSPSSR